MTSNDNKPVSKQAQLLSGAIKRARWGIFREHKSSFPCRPDDPAKSQPQSQSQVHVVGRLPTALVALSDFAVDSSSDSSGDSDSAATDSDSDKSRNGGDTIGVIQLKHDAVENGGGLEKNKCEAVNKTTHRTT